MLLGVLLSTISWGLIVVVAVLARQLALKVKGINYPFLIACVYFANNVWVTGLSSSNLDGPNGPLGGSDEPNGKSSL